MWRWMRHLVLEDGIVPTLLDAVYWFSEDLMATTSMTCTVFAFLHKHHCRSILETLLYYLARCLKGSIRVQFLFCRSTSDSFRNCTNNFFSNIVTNSLTKLWHRLSEDTLCSLIAIGPNWNTCKMVIYAIQKYTCQNKQRFSIFVVSTRCVMFCSKSMDLQDLWSPEHRFGTITRPVWGNSTKIYLLYPTFPSCILHIRCHLKSFWSIRLSFISTCKILERLLLILLTSSSIDIPNQNSNIHSIFVLSLMRWEHFILTTWYSSQINTFTIVWNIKTQFPFKMCHPTTWRSFKLVLCFWKPTFSSFPRTLLLNNGKDWQNLQAILWLTTWRRLFKSSWSLKLTFTASLS